MKLVIYQQSTHGLPPGQQPSVRGIELLDYLRGTDRFFAFPAMTAPSRSSTLQFAQDKTQPNMPRV